MFKNRKDCRKSLEKNRNKIENNREIRKREKLIFVSDKFHRKTREAKVIAVKERKKKRRFVSERFNRKRRMRKTWKKDKKTEELDLEREVQKCALILFLGKTAS